MKTVVILLVLANCTLAQGVADFDKGERISKQFRYGAGEHYLYKSAFKKYKTPKIISKLDKGNDSYVLSVSPDSIFSLVSTKKSTHQISVNFKMKSADPVYLVDIVYLENNEFIIALANEQYGYDFIRFMKLNDRYTPYVYASAFVLPGLLETISLKGKEVGLNADGSFFIKKTDDSIDTYKIVDGQNRMLRNDVVFDRSQVVLYNNGLPNNLKFEP